MKRVLVTPLDWGLGHATRCIPIVQKLIERNYEVFIAGSGPTLELLKLEFPKNTVFEIIGYNPWYSKRSMHVSMMLQFVKFIRVINTEHQQINQIVKHHKIDVVISDNRYGAWSNEVPSIIITHQITIPPLRGLGWLSSAVNYFNHKQLKKFSQCWIPDAVDSKYSGKLSQKHQDFPSIKHIGILSRFKPMQQPALKYQVAVLISGPEPQRTEFEKIIFSQLELMKIKAVVVRGVIDCSTIIDDKEFEVFNHLESEQLNEVMEQSSVIVSRSGYTTVMDLAMLGKKAIFVPTPGQPEQNYLASYFMEQNIAPSYTQATFNLGTALQQVRSFTGFSREENSDDLLDKVLDNLQS